VALIPMVALRYWSVSAPSNGVAGSD
jgi:hypothetical protein